MDGRGATGHDGGNQAFSRSDVPDGRVGDLDGLLVEGIGVGVSGVLVVVVVCVWMAVAVVSQLLGKVASVEPGLGVRVGPAARRGKGVVLAAARMAARRRGEQRWFVLPIEGTERDVGREAARTGEGGNLERNGGCRAAAPVRGWEREMEEREKKEKEKGVCFSKRNEWEELVAVVLWFGATLLWRIDVGRRSSRLPTHQLEDDAKEAKNKSIKENGCTRCSGRCPGVVAMAIRCAEEGAS